MDHWIALDAERVIHLLNFTTLQAFVKIGNLIRVIKLIGILAAVFSTNKVKACKASGMPLTTRRAMIESTIMSFRVNYVFVCLRSWRKMSGDKLERVSQLALEHKMSIQTYVHGGGVAMDPLDELRFCQMS